jgi:hypothetical protein
MWFCTMIGYLGVEGEFFLWTVITVPLETFKL